MDWLIDWMIGLWDQRDVSDVAPTTCASEWGVVTYASLSPSHQSDESYRRGVHINRRSSHSLSVIFIHNPNRISILTSEFPPLLKQVDLLSVVLLAWIFNPRVVYTRPGYHGNGYERLNWDTGTDFFTFWIDPLLFLQHIFIFAFLSTYHFRLSCDTVLKPRIFFQDNNALLSINNFTNLS